ncbi:large-conductance mechanosensitive channel protein MscL [Tenacibaculum sp. MEBiC06402]|uniref:large-conductance mechanosensitive channel protein MscL n=1 Tax=unclassified Tenacibaculum TaxID=2635139 RepID=UPI003B9D4DFC
MGMLKEFKDFAMKGNLVDIAVGFVMGAGFNKVVSSFTGGIVSPLIGMIGGTNFNDLKYVLKEGVADDLTGKVTGEVAVLYGAFITNVIDFIIVAFVMFMIVKGVNAMKKKEEEAPAAPAGPTQEELLAEIRDLLKKN